jgi:hypothetical protein
MKRSVAERSRRFCDSRSIRKVQPPTQVSREITFARVVMLEERRITTEKLESTILRSKEATKAHVAVY